MSSLVVSEIFGPTLQGEGPSAGRPAMFLRLGRCNLDCSWCDTPYTWDWDRFDPAVELRSQSDAEVLDALERIDAPLLVITGGEPLLQQRRLHGVVSGARARGWRVEVETNGTIAPSPDLVDLVDGWNVSPKLAGSGIARDRRIVEPALRALVATGRAAAKFVVSSAAELAEADEVVALAGFTDVWLMPEGTTAPAVMAGMAALAPLALERRWNLSPRLHVLLWGDERGR